MEKSEGCFKIGRLLLVIVMLFMINKGCTMYIMDVSMDVSIDVRVSTLYG